MAINPEYAGRTFEPSEPYEVSRVKIAEFATAIGDASPLCRDRAAAQAAGYPDVIAPPTLAIVITSGANARLMALSWSAFIAREFGPMKRMLQLSHTSAKCAFSAKNPYPG